LDPTTGYSAYDGMTFLLTDSRGFHPQLPPTIIDAFRATLENRRGQLAASCGHISSRDADVQHQRWQTSRRTSPERETLGPGAEQDRPFPGQAGATDALMSEKAALDYFDKAPLEAV
jgi:hypothetical protein